MPSSISSSRRRWLALLSFALVLGGLMAAWEWVVRANYNPPVAINYASSQVTAHDPAADHWLAFGNCLVLNGVSPGYMFDQWQQQAQIPQLPTFHNISQHEHSPIAYLAYLERAGYYPGVIITNVSSWLDSANHELETEHLVKLDPLNLFGKTGSDSGFAVGVAATAAADSLQQRTETALQQSVDGVLKQAEKRYHLFDFALFIYHLLGSGNLEQSLYQLGLQSWYQVDATQEDGFGQIAFDIAYTDRWQQAQETMAQKQLLRMRAGTFLTPRFWQTLREQTERFSQRGTRILLLRMPEHPQIRAFNEQRYAISEHLTRLQQQTGIAVLDLEQHLAPGEVRLYDAVHPDRAGGERISRLIADWINTHHPDWLQPRAAP